MTTNDTQADDSQADDSHTAAKYRSGIGKTSTLLELTEQIAVSPVGWTCFDPKGDDAIAFLDLRTIDEASGGDE